MGTKRPDQLYITPAGLRRWAARVAAARRAWLDVCATNEEAAGAGDSSVWHDNFAWEENQRQLHQLARRVKELEEAFARLRVVEPARQAPGRVRVGCTVSLFFPDDGSERRFYVAGFEDGDPDSGRVSYTAPLARAVIGAAECDLRRVEIGGRVREVEIAAIDAAPGDEL